MRQTRKRNRNIRRILSCLLLLFLLSACGQQVSDNGATPDAMVESIAGHETTHESRINSASPSMSMVEQDERAKLYQDYAGRVRDGLSTFQQMINSNEEFGSVSTLVIESRVIIGASTEGGELTRFMTPDGRIVRYTFQILGETGRAMESYYYFDDGLVYIQVLDMRYADWNFGNPNQGASLTTWKFMIAKAGKKIPMTKVKR